MSKYYFPLRLECSCELTSVLDRKLREYASQPREAVGQVELEQDTIEQLKALGYVE